MVKTKKKNARSAISGGGKKKATPFADAGTIAGAKLGQMFNIPMLKGIGRWLGSGIGTVFGSGDYQLVGNQPTYNVLMNGAQIPKFSTSRQTNIVCHREYLGDVLGTAGFSLNRYPLNPGMSETFPWLSTLAQGYQEYKFHGMIFEFRSLVTDFVTNGAPGVVIMATNYNADAPVYSSKQEMENSEYAVATKPTINLVHGIECADGQNVLNHLFVRAGDVPTGQDLRLYDAGNFQIATQGNPVQLIGELWVSYCVEFFKPILPQTVGGEVASAHLSNFAVSNTNPLGTVRLYKVGTMTTNITPTTVSFFTIPGNVYLVNFTWRGGTNAVITAPIFTFTSGLALVPYFNQAAETSVPEPANGISSGGFTVTFIYVDVSGAPGLETVTVGGAGVLPTNNTCCDITITTLDSSITK